MTHLDFICSLFINIVLVSLSAILFAICNIVLFLVPKTRLEGLIVKTVKLHTRLDTNALLKIIIFNKTNKQKTTHTRVRFGGVYNELLFAVTDRLKTK